MKCAVYREYYKKPIALLNFTHELIYAMGNRQQGVRTWEGHKKGGQDKEGRSIPKVTPCACWLREIDTG